MRRPAFIRSKPSQKRGSTVSTEEPTTVDPGTRRYIVEYDQKQIGVLAKSRKQAIGFVARREEQRIRDLATVRVATFEDGQMAERLGIALLDATGAEEDPHQLDLGV